MVCDLTIGKEKWQDGWNIAEEAMRLSVKIMSRAGELVDEDSDAFDEVMASFKLPKGVMKKLQFAELQLEMPH